jgi:Ca2+-binding RTX toxin-like protein
MRVLLRRWCNQLSKERTEMAATVNSVSTAPDAHGITQGTSASDRIAGNGGDNKLQGNGGGDIFYGGTGNDTFIIKASDLHSGPSTVGNIGATDVIFDFGGAGGWAGSNNDFIALVGFGAGSTATFSHYGANADMTANNSYQYYTVHDTTTGTDTTIFVHSLNGNKLLAGDFAFY